LVKRKSQFQRYTRGSEWHLSDLPWGLKRRSGEEKEREKSNKEADHQQEERKTVIGGEKDANGKEGGLHEYRIVNPIGRGKKILRQEKATMTTE